MWSLNSFTLFPTDSLCGGGRAGEDAPGKGTILGAERHAGGTSFPLGLEKKAHGRSRISGSRLV